MTDNCPKCGARAIEIPWANGGDWLCGSRRGRIDMQARQSWSCATIAEQNEVMSELAESLRAFAAAYPFHPTVFSPSTVVGLNAAQGSAVDALARYDKLTGGDDD